MTSAPNAVLDLIKRFENQLAAEGEVLREEKRNSAGIPARPNTLVLGLVDQVQNIVGRSTENTAEHSGVPDSGAVFTIGHSNAPLENLLSLLHGNAIQVLVDVRGSPYSRHVPQANREPLEAALRASGLKYLFMGEQLGGRPDGISVRDITGSLDYAKLGDSERFREGMRRLMNRVAQYRVCLLCSEEDPGRCHRGLLIGKELKKRGVEVRHIRHTGQVESQAELEARLPPVQKTLFPEM